MRQYVFIFTSYFSCMLKSRAWKKKVQSLEWYSHCDICFLHSHFGSSIPSLINLNFLLISFLFLSQPHSMSGVDSFGGLGATLVDSLDTLFIMGLDTQFKRAREWVVLYILCRCLKCPYVLLSLYIPFHLYFRLNWKNKKKKVFFSFLFV